MKKNIMMRLSALLLVAVLLTTCVISGTFAKYVTTGSASDSAKVAKWGVEITAETWADDNLEADLTAAEDHIVASASSDLLAPGTGVHFASVNVTGQPDVAVKVTYTADLELAGWALADSSVYCPLVFVINGDAHSYAGVTASSVDDFEAKIEAYIAAYTEEYSAGVNLADFGAGKLTVSCYWAYESGNDSADSYLGNQASIGNAPTVNLTINCTVTQVE